MVTQSEFTAEYIYDLSLNMVTQSYITAGYIYDLSFNMVKQSNFTAGSLFQNLKTTYYLETKRKRK